MADFGTNMGRPEKPYGLHYWTHTRIASWTPANNSKQISSSMVTRLVLAALCAGLPPKAREWAQQFYLLMLYIWIPKKNIFLKSSNLEVSYSRAKSSRFGGLQRFNVLSTHLTRSPLLISLSLYKIVRFVPAKKRDALANCTHVFIRPPLM